MQTYDFDLFVVGGGSGGVRAGRMALDVSAKRQSLTWTFSKANRARESSRLNGIYVQLLNSAGVNIIKGWARLLDSYTWKWAIKNTPPKIY